MRGGAVGASPARLAEIAVLLLDQHDVTSLCTTVLQCALEISGCRHGRVVLTARGRREDTAVAASACPEHGDAEAGPADGPLLTLPLTGPDRPLGAILLHGRAAAEVQDAARGQLDWLAGFASRALAVILEREQLHTALATRTVIGQAQGILMERYGIDGERAFQVLRRYSQNGNTRLSEVAADVVATSSLPEAQ